MPLCVFCAGTGLSMGHGTGWVPCPRGCEVPVALAVGDDHEPRMTAALAAVRGNGGRASFGQLARAMGCSLPAVHAVVRRLEDRGELKRTGSRGHYVFSLAKNSA